MASSRYFLFLSLSLFFFGCAQPGSRQAENFNTTVSEGSTVAYRAWGFCVFRSSEGLADGSEDVKLIVNTALGQCENEKLTWRSSLARDNLNSDFADSYYREGSDGIRNSAEARVLKKKAGQKQG